MKPLSIIFAGAVEALSATTANVGARTMSAIAAWLWTGTACKITPDQGYIAGQYSGAIFVHPHFR